MNASQSSTLVLVLVSSAAKLANPNPVTRYYILGFSNKNLQISIVNILSFKNCSIVE
jgi:hypothetical protein